MSGNIDTLLANPSFTAGNLGIDVASGTFTYGSAITPTIGVVKLGAGTLVSNTRHQ